MDIPRTIGYTEIVKIAECALNGDSERAKVFIKRYIGKYPDKDLVYPFTHLLNGVTNPSGLNSNIIPACEGKADSTSEKDLRVCEVIASASESFEELSQSERYNLTDETISKFKNGKMLYRKSALFNRSVQMLVRGVTVYDLIENIIQVTEDTTRSFEQYINRDDRPLTMR